MHCRQICRCLRRQYYFFLKKYLYRFEILLHHQRYPASSLFLLEIFTDSFILNILFSEALGGVWSLFVVCCVCCLFVCCLLFAVFVDHLWKILLRVCSLVGACRPPVVRLSQQIFIYQLSKTAQWAVRGEVSYLI